MLELVLESILKGTNDVNSLAKIYGVSRGQLRELLKGLDGISLSEERIVIDNKVRLIVSALNRGVPPNLLSRYLTWREFEDEVSRILSVNGYTVYSNLIFRTTRRWQVDVVAFSGSKILVIDCKHWKKVSKYGLEDAASNHYQRALGLSKSVKLAELALKSNFEEGHLIPVIVVLSSSYKGIMNGVFVVPIQYFEGFLREIDFVTEEAEKISFTVKGRPSLSGGGVAKRL